MKHEPNSRSLYYCCRFGVESCILAIYNQKRSKQKLDTSARLGGQKFFKHQYFLDRDDLVVYLPCLLGGYPATAPGPSGFINYCGDEDTYVGSIFILPNNWCHSRSEISNKTDGQLLTP